MNPLHLKQLIKEINDDYRRQAITLSEREELTRAVQDVDSIQEARRVVSEHRRGRVANEEVQRSEVPSILADELKNYPTFRVKFTSKKLVFSVGKFNPEVKAVTISDLNKGLCPVKILMKNGMEGWGWDAYRQPFPVFKDDHGFLKADWVFDGAKGRQAEREFRAFVKSHLVPQIKKCGMIWRPDLNETIPLSKNKNAPIVTGIKRRDDLKPKEKYNSITYKEPTFYEILGSNLTKTSEKIPCG